jgi:hypothetical protein
VDQETAYKVLMSFASGPRLESWMQKVLDGSWEVSVKTPTHGIKHLATREAARALWRQLQAEGVIAA